MFKCVFFAHLHVRLIYPVVDKFPPSFLLITLFRGGYTDLTAVSQHFTDPLFTSMLIASVSLGISRFSRHLSVSLSIFRYLSASLGISRLDFQFCSKRQEQEKKQMNR